MMKTQLVSLTAMFFLLTGCASKWEHPIKSENDFSVDKYTCEQESVKLYPPLILSSPFQGGYTASPMGYYPFYGTGYFRRGLYYSPVFTVEDYNEANRKKTFQSCMNTLGWEWIFKW
jgi:hypothetical protein